MVGAGGAAATTPSAGSTDPPLSPAQVSHAEILAAVAVALGNTPAVDARPVPLVPHQPTVVVVVMETTVDTAPGFSSTMQPRYHC